MTMIIGWFGRCNHPCLKLDVMASRSFLHVAGTLSMRQAFVGCMKVPYCTSGEESDLSCTSRISDSLGCDFGDDGDSLESVLEVDDSLEFALLDWLSSMMLGHSSCWNVELTCCVDYLA